MIGYEKDKEKVASLYQPEEEIKELIKKVKEDYNTCWENLNRPYTEFNNLSVIQIMERDQKLFNEYVEDKSADPRLSWQADSIRPLTRNKVIGIAAYVIASMLYPNVTAQNNEDEIDRMASQIMKDLLEWIIEDEKTDYKTTFLYAVIGALVNPASFIKVEYVQALQTIKKLINGEYKSIDVTDDILSGLHINTIPADEIYIHNPYEYNLQRQKCVFRRRYIPYGEAEALHGRHDDFKYVQSGIRIFYEDSNDGFYQQKDDENPDMVEELTYYNRQEDVELVFVNGVLVSKPDQRIKHRTEKDYPRYPFVKFGYEPIDEKKFFYYKSLVSKLWHQQRIADRMWNLVLDGSFMSIMPPINVFGPERVDTGVIIPGATNYFGEDVQVQPLETGKNISAGVNALTMIDDVASESSQDRARQGLGGGSQTARGRIYDERNANIQLGLFGTMVAGAVVQLGGLLVDMIVQHMTVGEVEEITAGQTRLKFRTFLLPNKKHDGKNVTKKIIFTDEYSGMQLTDEEILKESFKMFNEGGKLDPTTVINKVNPKLFANLKFLVSINTTDIGPKNEELEKAFKLEGYDRLITNPYIDPVEVTRDFLVDPLADGETDKYMKKEADQGGLASLGIQPNQQPGSNLTNQITKPTDSLNALV